MYKISNTSSAKILSFVVFCFISIQLIAQPADYYNGAVGLDGSALKTALHNKIKNHTVYDYSTIKQILKLADEDPNNSDNIILVYTGWSIPKANFASNMDSLNFWNREHIWAKSHGDFGTDPGPGTDAHALKPGDATVNSARSYKDFDNGGTQYYDAGIPTGCYSDADSWEPRDEVKGDVARMIFYMATRYEGTDGEIDLEVVDAVNTYPAPEHGKLSTLLEWNIIDPPDAFEKDRNDMIFNWQHNRNPFIDYPEFADYIWNNVSASPIQITSVTLDPDPIIINDPVELSAQVSHTSGGTITSVTLSWGLSWNNLSNTSVLTGAGNTYSALIPGQSALTRVYYSLLASDGSEEKYFWGFYDVPNEPFSGTLTSIYDIQGQGPLSQMQGQVISTSGIVTGAFGSNFFLQDGNGPWNGIYVYSSGYFPSVGDSVIVTAEVAEYYTMTELKNVSQYYYISSYHMLPDPIVLPTGSMQDEQYESCLVKLENALCVRDTLFGMWFVNDGTGDALIHNSSIFSFDYVIGNIYTITGPLNFDFDEFKIELRSEDDVLAGIDSQPPFINDIIAANSTVVNIYFSEKIDNTTGSNLSNYSISNGVNVVSASLHAFDKSKVILLVSEMPDGTYTLTINDVEDLSGNAISNLQAQFSYPYNSIDFISPENISVWPNPTHGEINIEFIENYPGDIEIELYDMSGRKVNSQLFINPQDKIEFSFNSNIGIYFMHIISKDGIYVSKIVNL